MGWVCPPKTRGQARHSLTLSFFALRRRGHAACWSPTCSGTRRGRRRWPQVQAPLVLPSASPCWLSARRRWRLEPYLFPAQVRAARDQPAPARKVISILVLLTLRDTLSNLFMYIQILTMKEHYVNSISNSLYCISRLNLGFSLLFSF